MDKAEFAPRITRRRQRLARLEAQRQTVAEEAALQGEWPRIMGRLEAFAAQRHDGLAMADWTRQRDRIRTLVKRVEVAQNEGNSVFRVDPYPGDADPEKKSWQLCRGREDSTLRGAFVRGCQRSRFPHASVQPLADQPQESSILDPLRDKRPQKAPVSMVDTSPHLRIHSPRDVQLPALLPQVVQRLRRTVALPKAGGKGREVLLEDRRQDHDHCPLDTLVRKAGLAEWPLLSSCLLDPYPLDWRRHLPMVAQSLMQVPPVGLQVLGGRRGRHLVAPRGTRLAGQTIGCQKQVTVDQMNHAVAHHRWRALCLLGNPLELHGYSS